MIPVITNELKNSVLSYLTNSCVGFLIYMPELGLSRNPTGEEFILRRDLTLEEAVKREIGGLSLNGYQRCRASIILESNESFSRVVYTVEFQAYGGTLGPFTHVCISRGTPFTEDPITGNGRGESTGQLIAVMPVNTTTETDTIGLSLTEPEIYRVNIPLNFTNYVM